jgi:Uma2 family endonuclease
MTSLLPVKPQTDIFYPSSDGEPLAETQVHVDAIIGAVVALRQYLGERAIVLADQFLYYSQGYPKLRVAPDAMVIFDVPPGSRDNYKIWEEGQIPAVVFEMTSEGTRHQDEGFKRTLYEQLGVLEYWQFDPKGEWIPEQLRGFRLRGDVYEPIADSCSEPLQLRLQVEGQLIGFYREDTGEKLLIPDELAQALRSEVEARQQAEQRAEQAEQQLEQERQRAEQERQRADRLAEYLRSQGIDPDSVD